MYYAGFDLSQVSGLGTLTLATAGKSSIVITLGSITDNDSNSVASSLFFHAPNNPNYIAVDSSGDDRLLNYSVASFAQALYGDMVEGAIAQSWTSPASLVCTIAEATGLISFTYPVANFSLTWSTAAGRQFCGFASNQSGAQSYTGTIVPPYCISPTLPSASNWTVDYEPTGIANHIIADDGQGYGVSREVSPVCRDWVQQFETKEKTFTANATSTHPYTYEALIKHCRGQYPFAVVDGFGDTADYVFFLRSESTQWHPERASDGNDAQFHIPFKTWVEGTA
jgi:hypothetical protein